MERHQIIPIAQPMIGKEEKLAVLEVLGSGMLTQGPKVAAFEAAFAEMCGTKCAVATSSGTTALHLALLAHGIEAGDEVIIPSFSFIATANAVIYSGARPVFVDIDAVTFNLDPNKIEDAITPRSKAILPVHLFGLPCDMSSIMDIAQIHGLVVVEDACQAHGAEVRGKRVGSFGTGCFSLYPTKNITSAEGGMITTDTEYIAEKCRIMRQHGMRKQYYHDELGFNFRMTDVHAAIGLEQLKKLEHFNERRIANALYLSNHLGNMVTPVVPEGYRHVFHQYTVRVPDGRRDELLAGLLERGIEARVYYPVPIHQQGFYRQMGYDGRLPETERACQEVLSLPAHPGLVLDDLERIVTAVNELRA